MRVFAVMVEIVVDDVADEDEARSVIAVYLDDMPDIRSWEYGEVTELTR